MPTIATASARAAVATTGTYGMPGPCQGRELCARVAFLSNGKIVAMDTPTALKLRYGTPSARLLLQNRSELTVDLESMEITHGSGLRVPFELDAYARETLLHGLDDIARTLKREAKIAAYESSARPRFDTRVVSR